MFNKLVAFSERYYLGNLENIEETVPHLSSFISAFANILLELPASHIEDFHLHHLESLLGTLFLILPRLYPGRRRQNYWALSRLFFALLLKGNVLQRLLSRIVLQCLMLTCTAQLNAEAAARYTLFLFLFSPLSLSLFLSLLLFISILFSLSLFQNICVV